MTGAPRVKFSGGLQVVQLGFVPAVMARDGLCPRCTCGMTPLGWMSFEGSGVTACGRLMGATPGPALPPAAGGAACAAWAPVTENAIDDVMTASTAAAVSDRRIDLLRRVIPSPEFALKLPLDPNYALAPATT
jgi:hypothetical protein